MGRLEQLHQLTSSQRSGMLFPFVFPICWRSVKHRFSLQEIWPPVCFSWRLSVVDPHCKNTWKSAWSLPGLESVATPLVGKLRGGDLCHAETEAEGLLRDQPGKVRQRSIQEMIGEGNKWKGGINEHSFLQKIKTVESKMYKWRIRKGEKNQIAYVEKIMRKGNWNDSFISLNSTYFVLLGPSRKAGMAGMTKSIERTYLRWIS